MEACTARKKPSRTIRQDSFCTNFPLDDWLLFQIMTQGKKTSASRFIDDYVEYQATLLLILMNQGYRHLVKREMESQATPVMASLNCRRNIDAQLEPHGTALHVAMGRSDLETINLLIDSGADINAQCGSLGSPLQLAVSRNKTDTFRALLARGADVNTKARNLTPPLHIAAERNNVEIIELLTAGGTESATKCEQLGIALLVAVSNNNNAAVNALLSKMGC